MGVSLPPGRTRVPFPFAVGRGLSRDTGLAAVSPQAPVDARNVYARAGKMEVRPGLTGTGYPTVNWGTDLLAVEPIAASGDVLFVVYDRVSNAIQVYVLLVAVGAIDYVGTWGTLNALAAFPIVKLAESNAILTIAHNEANLSYRLQTMQYAVNVATPTSPGTLTGLSQDLAGVGVVSPVYFRGVYQYLYYVMGWGYGSVNDPDRGDILRYCNATDPTTWLPTNNFNAGVQNVPIVDCVVTMGIAQANASTQQTILAVLKEDSTYQVIGTDPGSFGILALDDKYGAVSARCSINIGGRAFTWSDDGAREMTAGGTTLWAQPLELDSPLPSDFPVLGPDRDVFVAYDEPRKRIIWAFPDLVNAYAPVAAFCLSLWDPKDPRWTMEVIQQPVSCAGGRIFSDPGGAAPPAPAGYASAVSAVDVGISANPADRTVNVTWTNNFATGSEIVHLWAQIGAGAWIDVAQFPVAGTGQTAAWAGALPLTAYTLGLAYYNGTTPGTGYSGSPAVWTASTAAGSQTTVTTSVQPVSWVSGAFVDASTPVSLVWADAQTGVPYLLEKNPGSGYVTLASGLVATTYSYAIPSAELGSTTTFRVTPQNGAVSGTPQTLAVPMYVTVGTPTWASASFTASTRTAALVWNAASNALQYLLEKSDDGGVTWSTVAIVAATSYNYTPTDAELNATVDFRLTGQNGSTSGSTSGTQALAMTFSMGTPTLTLGAISNANGTVGLSWTAASLATSYLVEKNVNGGGWTTATTASPTSNSYFVQQAEVAATIQFRVTGKNGGYLGTASNVVNTTLAITLGVAGTPTVSSYGSGGGYGLGKANLTWAAAGGDLYATAIQGGNASGFASPTLDSVSGPPDPGSGFCSKYSTPQTQARVLSEYLGGRYSAYSGAVALAWP